MLKNTWSVLYKLVMSPKDVKGEDDRPLVLFKDGCYEYAGWIGEGRQASRQEVVMS